MSDREEALHKAQETMRRFQHEVRTPLGQIMGYSELIEEELEDRGLEELVPDLHKIRAAAKRLLDLVDGKLQHDTDAGAPPLSAEEEPSAESAAEPDGAPARPSDASGSRLLVVDDDANNRDLLVRRLGKHGFRVDTARDGIEGLRRIETGDYDLVLLDVMMPGMSGLEVLERVRRTRSMSELPIILATALDASADAVEGLEHGANDYLTKPFDFPVVIARVETHLAAHRSSREVASLARQLEFRNVFIRQALGREVSDDLLVELAETPDAVDLAGERRRVTALVADLKGTRERAASLPPAALMKLLDTTLSALSDVVSHYEGTVNALPGDSLVALFGLPVAGEDDAQRAVACAVAMQLEIEEVNARNARSQLPAVGIGVGVATGDVIAGGIGSGDKLKFKVIGEPIPRAASIEATAGEQEVWICAETAEAAGDVLQTDRQREVELPGAESPAGVQRVLGVGGSYLISLREVPPAG